MVTKYTFSALLNDAWGKTMIPNVISSGFKRSGIYPFNPNSIDHGIDGSSSEKKSNDEQGTKSISTNVSSVAENSEMQQRISFSAKQEKLYDMKRITTYLTLIIKIYHPFEHVHKPS